MPGENVSEPTLPAHKRNVGFMSWLLLELRDHLWPWSAEGWRSQRALQIAGLSLAVAATIAWIMAAMGHLSSGAIISISAVTALWSASRGVYSIVSGLNSVYDVQETRSYIKTRLLALFYTFSFLIILVALLLVPLL